MPESQQPSDSGTLGVVHTKRSHEPGCPALSGEQCRCGGNAIANLLPDTDNPQERIAAINRAKDAGEAQRCPRRDEGYAMPVDGQNEDKPDHWVALDMGVIGARGGRHCSFCGSLHPDDFMRMITEGETLEPTDKNYKAYVSASEKVGPNGDKFYFQHLSVEQRKALVDMVNARTIHFGHPGGFYRLPFFMVRERIPGNGE